MLRFLWKKQKPVGQTLYFDDINVNEAFKNAGTLSKGAVYIKVKNSRDHQMFMQEIATGILFPPTKAPVKRVDLTITIDEVKPSIY